MSQQTAARRFVGNAAALGAAQVGANVLLLLNTVLLARALSVTEYGLLAVAVSVYGLTGFLGDAGLGIWGLRAIGGPTDRWATIWQLTAARTISVTCAVAVGTLGIVALPLPDGARMPGIVMILCMIPAGFGVDWVLLGLERTGRAGLVRIVVAVGMPVLCPVLAQVAGPMGAASGYLITSSVGAATSWGLVVATIGRPRFARPTGVWLTLRRSLPMGVNAVLNQTYWQSDSVLTGVLLGAGAAGLYAAPMRVLSSVVGLGWVVGTSLLPIYRSIDHVSGEVARLAATTTRLLLLACLPAVGTVIGGAAVIVTTLFGAGYAESAPVLAIGVLVVSLSVCVVPTGSTLLARHLDHVFAFSAGLAALVAILGILILAPTFGIMGVAGAMLAGAAANAAVLAGQAQREGTAPDGIGLARAIAGPALVGGTAGVAASLAPFGIIGVGLVGIVAELPLGVTVARLLWARRSSAASAASPHHFADRGQP